VLCFSGLQQTSVTTLAAINEVLATGKDANIRNRNRANGDAADSSAANSDWELVYFSRAHRSAFLGKNRGLDGVYWFATADFITTAHAFFSQAVVGVLGD
jgi:hypothetical protein